MTFGKLPSVSQTQNQNCEHLHRVDLQEQFGRKQIGPPLCVSGFEELSGSDSGLLILKYVQTLAQPKEVKIRMVPDVRTSGRGEAECHHHPAPLCQRLVAPRSEHRPSVARYVSKMSLNPLG